MSVSKEQVETAYKQAKRADRASVLVGISPSHFKRLMHKYDIEFLPRTEQPGRCNAWNPTCSKDLAYVLGVLIGDGYVAGRVRGNAFRIHLQVTDRVFTEQFRNALDAIGLRPTNIRVTQDKRPNRKPRYWVWANSKLFATWYLSLTLAEIEGTWIKGHEADFVRGVWESEGHLIPENSYYDATIGMTRQDVILLVARILDQWGLHPKVQGPYKDRRGAKNIYRVALHRTAEVKTFMAITSPCIRRAS